jgi:hypothetical protein
MWAGLFYRYFKNHPADDMVGRVVGWLLKGSILELIIAVPCHIVVRHRQDCCAPFATFWGISMGVGVMLLSFGPGVLFLFLDRMKQKRPKASLSSSP